MLKINVNAQSVYSQELRDLLTRCVQYRPDDRITPTELLEDVLQRTVGEADNDEEEEKDDLQRARKSASEDDRLLWRPKAKEHYGIGFAADEWEVRISKEAEDEKQEEDAVEAKEKATVKEMDDAADKAARAEVARQRRERTRRN